MLKLLRYLIRALFCDHEFVWVRNFYADEIILNGWKRSLWECRRCGWVRAEDWLHDPRKPRPEDQR